MTDADQAINTHHKRVTFGKFRNELWTRVPVSYLRWIGNLEPYHAHRDMALAELIRRGTTLQDRFVEISGHAVDSASLRLWTKYKKTRENCNEGLHAWLIRKAGDALNAREIAPDGHIEVDGVRYIFETGALYPVLKTVMKPNNR